MTTVPVGELPRLDEHAVEVAAPPEAVWDAAAEVFGRSTSGPGARLVARALGCDPAAPEAWPAVGGAIPGFRVVGADRPRSLAIAGRHRFARYAIVLRVEPSGAGARCRLESRATFPGPRGALYRLAVVGTGGHVVAVRRLLRRIRQAAERSAASAR